MLNQERCLPLRACLTSQRHICGLKITVESQVFEPPRETKIGSKNQTEIRNQKSGVKLWCSTEGGDTTFGSSYQEVRKSNSRRNKILLYV